jgi:SAM-dependent methyltransferase
MTCSICAKPKRLRKHGRGTSLFSLYRESGSARLAGHESREHHHLPRESALNSIAELEAQIAALKAQAHRPQAPVKLDLGCGNTTRRSISGLTRDKGWIGVDLPGTDGADVHCDLGTAIWPFADNSVDESISSHMLEHVPRQQRGHFFNELWRVMKPGAKAAFTTPHWASCRAYGDPTHEWPPISEMFWCYLDKEWRAQNAPHTPFTCDFTGGYGYTLAAWLNGRNAEYVQEALTKYKEAAQDMQATLVARKAG